MKKFLIAALAIITYISVDAQQQPSITGNKNLSYKIIPAANNTWGYDIYNNGKLFLHQPSIPALPGNNGFATKSSAEKVAKKVIEKINKGENPPTISVDEMKELGAIPKQ